MSDDPSVPKALQAGANSILRKPLVVNQVTDTLTTARDLLRPKQESAVQAAAGASAGGSISALPANQEPGSERTLRAGEFLNSAPLAPGGQFVTESEVHEFKVSSSVEKDLEPMAASVEEAVAPPPPPPPETGETRGLEWYLKTRGGTVPHVSGLSAAAAAPALAKPELLGYDQPPAYTPAPAASSTDSAAEPPHEADSDSPEVRGQHQGHDQERSHEKHEQRKEAELFSYITEGMEPEKAPRAPLRLGKGAIIAALALASCAIVAAPQAPWHAGVKSAWARGRQTVHGWLNPQLVTTPQAPITHEDFGRAGDEYKLPVTENIPDATTDPSQIHVIPVVDPTVKKLNNMGENAEPGDPASATPADPTADPGSTPSSAPDAAQPAGGTSATPGPGAVSAPALTTPATSVPAGSNVPASNSAGSTTAVPSSTVAAAVATTPHPNTPVVVAPPPAVSVPVSPQPHPVSAPANVPSSLKSQMASMTPDAGGNKTPEAAMQAIEPVIVPEAAERALLTDQPAFDSTANGTGQPATVILQVLVGRDGTVQDAKFLQGSLAFARVAIDGVRRWKFKPYIMNGRPVSVQTPMTLSFKPAP